MNIKVTADSTCDLTAEQIQSNNITITPLKVNMGDNSYTDGVDITPSDIFAHVANGGPLCSTAACNIDDYISVFDKFSKEYDAVIHISLGSAFSSCYQNACVAAQDYPNVYVVDSQNLSTGQGLVVLETCERANSCENAEQLANDIRDLTSRVEASFILNKLDYMVKGGRCSTVAALGANLLKLKPCIEVIGGKMQVVKKYRGSYAKCLEEYIRERLDGRADVEMDKIFITHTPVEADELNVAKDSVSKYGSFSRVMESEAGCTISCHCGPSTLGVLYIRK